MAIKGKVFQEDFDGIWQEKGQAGSSRLLGKRKGTWEEGMILTPSSLCLLWLASVIPCVILRMGFFFFKVMDLLLPATQAYAVMHRNSVLL